MKTIIYYYYYIKYLLKIRSLQGKHPAEVIGAMYFSLKIHHSVRQDYKGKPYFFHTFMVWQEVYKYDPLNVIAQIAALLHDTIEDCRLTYNDIVKLFGVEVADVVYAVSNEKGKNREERANKKYYDGIINFANAEIVKLADRIANIKEGIRTNSSMLKKYVKEAPKFNSYFWTQNVNTIKFKMVKDLEELLAQC